MAAGAGAEVARVVHEQVDPAHAVEARGQGLAMHRVGDVADQRERLGEFRRDQVQVGLGPGVQNQAPAASLRASARPKPFDAPVITAVGLLAADVVMAPSL